MVMDLARPQGALAPRRRPVRLLLQMRVTDRPGQPFPGTDEAAQCPAMAEIATAVAGATGAHIRDLPLSQSRLPASPGP